MSVHTYKEIIKKAKTCKNNVKKSYKLGFTDKWCYPFAKSILNPGKDIKKIKFGDNPNPVQDKISETATKNEYIKLAKQIVEFVEGPKNRLPNYVTFRGKKVAPRLLTYDFAKILVRYDSTKKLQNEVKIVSSVFHNPHKKHGHATKHGCDNIGQNNGYYCGCHSLQEVIRNLTGKVIPQSTIASIAGTTSSGTDHAGLNTVIAWFNKKYGYNLQVEWKNFSEIGWKGIKKICESNNQDCIIHNAYRRTSDFGGYGHYETVNKVYNTYCDVQNSLGDKCSQGCYCGYVEERDLSTFQYYINGISQKSVMVVTRQ